MRARARPHVPARKPTTGSRDRADQRRVRAIPAHVIDLGQHGAGASPLIARRRRPLPAIRPV
jgi:hypothetical protein